MRQRMAGAPRSDIERAAAHFGISEDEVTEEHLAELPERGYGLQAGTAAGTGGSNMVTAGVGAAIGALIAGPIGAAVGAALGAKLGEEV